MATAVKAHVLFRPEHNVAELEELRSWDRELHFTENLFFFFFFLFTEILLCHGKNHACCKLAVLQAT